MKRILTLLAAAGILAGLAPIANADPAADRKEFREFFQKKFPTVKFDDYANGFYVLPDMQEYRDQWNAYNEFPPYELGLANGRKTWETPFPDGKTFAGCFENGGRKAAAHYPRWDDAAQKIKTAEMDLMDCARQHGAALSFLAANLSKEQGPRVQLAELTAYFYSLSRGERVAPAVDFAKQPGALKAYEAGKKYWWQRRGQLNFACANCHMDLAGKNMGGNQPLSAALGHPVGWPAQRLEWGRLETIHFRYMTCNSQVRAASLPHGSEVYNNLQLYETFLSSGLPLTAPAMRN